MATKSPPYGTRLQYDADGTPPFTDLVDVIAIKAPNQPRGKIDTTWLESANFTKETIAGWREAGSMTFKVYFTHAQLTTLMGFYAAGTIYYWRIRFPLIDSQSTNGYLQFQGYLEAPDWDEISAKSDEAIQMTWTITVTGAVTFTAGS